MLKAVDVKVGDTIRMNSDHGFSLEKDITYTISGISPCTFPAGERSYFAVCRSCPGRIILQGYLTNFCLYPNGHPLFEVVTVTDSGEINIHEVL